MTYMKWALTDNFCQQFKYCRRRWFHTKICRICICKWKLLQKYFLSNVSEWKKCFISHSAKPQLAKHKETITRLHFAIIVYSNESWFWRSLWKSCWKHKLCSFIKWKALFFFQIDLNFQFQLTIFSGFSARSSIIFFHLSVKMQRDSIKKFHHAHYFHDIADSLSLYGQSSSSFQIFLFFLPLPKKFVAHFHLYAPSFQQMNKLRRNCYRNNLPFSKLSL